MGQLGSMPNLSETVIIGVVQVLTAHNGIPTRMSIPITRTKVIVPRRRPDLLSRQRLLDLLNDLLDYKLIIVAAPAGYGKTSLLVDLAHHLDLPVSWYALDALDRDTQRFIAHFIASIAQRFPDFGHQSMAALQSPSLDLDHMVTTIVNEAYEHIREHFVMVLDDYHFVDDCPEINHFVNRFVQAVDENCHLVFASRTLLPLPDLPLMVARSQVAGLSFEELSFRPDEIQALVLQNHHLTMPASAAEELARETEGWITGLLLSTQTMWQGMTDRLRVARVSGVGLYDYLAQQVLDQQPAPIREFLLRTSLLEEFDAELCAKVLGPADEASGGSWHHLIDTILRSNLFVLPVDDEATWVRYHHLFRDFLQARLARENPNEHVRILRSLAAIYAERCEWERARDLYRRLHDLEATADLIERAGPSMIQGGRLTALETWLDALPAEAFATRPGLVSLRGIVAVMLGEVERGLTLLNQAVSAFQSSNDRPNLARTLVRRAVAHRFLGNYAASLEDADQTLALTEADETLRAIRAEALRAKGICHNLSGQLNEAIKWLEQSLGTYDALGEVQNVAIVLMELGIVHTTAGRYDSALAHYTRALEYWRKTENISWQANLLNNLGVLYHLKGDYERAGQTFEDALDHARRSGHSRIEAVTLASIGDLYSDLEAAAAALDAYRQAREIARQIDHHFLLFYLDLAEASLARARGDLDRANELLESTRKRVESTGSTYERGLYALESGRLALAESRIAEAITHLELAVDALQSDGQHVEAARALLFLAQARAAGDEQSAFTTLESAFALAGKLDSRHTLVVAGREVEGLLKDARRHPVIGREVSQLIKQIEQFEQEIPLLRRRLRGKAIAVPFAPPKLAIQAFGRAQVAVDGRVLTTADWQTQSARDLFFCLLAHPGGLTKEEVGAIFWPDDSQAQLKLKFKNTIYRVRHALAQEAIQFDGERYCFNRDLDYESDVEAFREKLAQARTMIDPHKRATLYWAAVQLYKGPYLPEIDGEWVWTERERLWQAYVDVISKLAEHHLEMGEYEAALDVCRRALAEDPCLEEAHRLSMRAHAAMGNRAAIVRQFERCRQALLEEVNAPPSPQTETLYQTLIR